MAWEWVAPVATFASGLTGMWFTYKTGRRQNTSQITTLTKQLQENHRADLIKEKRQLYADYLGALNEASTVAVKILAGKLEIDERWQNREEEVFANVVKSDEVRRLLQGIPEGEEREKIIRDTIRKKLPLARRSLEEDKEPPCIPAFK